MKNKQIVITNQDSKLPLQKSKNLFDITRKILDKKELIESFLFKPFIMETKETLLKENPWREVAEKIEKNGKISVNYGTFKTMISGDELERI